MKNWRVPTIEELTFIIDYTKYNPSTLLPGMKASSYWSSTTYAYGTIFAWGVGFGIGGVGYGDKGYGYYVRCVRGGQSGLFNYKGKRFLKKKDCYLDKKTGLEWSLKNTGPMTWKEAMRIEN